MGFRKRAFEIVEVATDENDLASRAFDYLIILLIVLNTVAVLLESVASIRQMAGHGFEILETFSVVIFTLEYLLRLWACPEDPRYADGLRGRLRFMVQPMAVIDLLAILPFYFAFLGADLRVLRLLRLFRIFRVFKLSRYSDAMQTLGRVFWAQRAELSMSLFVGFLMMIIAASVVFAFEHDAQPRVFSSIPMTCWWAVATLTTIGYGDMAPVTPEGRFVAAIIAVMSVGLFAIPAGILGSGFTDELRKRREREQQSARESSGPCPHCGRSG